MKRLFWLVVGLGAGGVIGSQVVKSAREAKARYSPSGIAKRAGSTSMSFTERLKDAFEAGRSEMVLREAELRSELGLPER